MSIDAFNWALRQPLKGCQKFVLVILAHHANHDAICWPGIALIAKECGITRSSVSAHINALVEHKLISKTKRSDNRGYRRSNIYKLNLDMTIQSPKSQHREIQRRNFDIQSPDFDESNIQNLDGNIIERSLEQTIEQTDMCETESSMSSEKNQPTSSKIQDIFRHWKTVMDHPSAKFDDKRRKKIKQALELGYTVEQLKQAINGCSLSPYHAGNNPENKRYDRIDLIFRSADQIEQFISYAINPPKKITKSNSGTNDLMAGAI